MSNLTILMDTSGKPIQQAESVFTKGETGNFHLTTYVDGAVKKNNENTGIRYVSEAQQREGLRQAASAVTAEGGRTPVLVWPPFSGSAESSAGLSRMPARAPAPSQ